MDNDRTKNVKPVNFNEEFDNKKFVKDKLELTNKLQVYNQKNLTEKEKIDLITKQNSLLRELLNGSYEYAVKSASILGAKYSIIRTANTNHGDCRCMKCNKKLNAGDIVVKTEGHDLFGIKISKYICLNCMDKVLTKMIRDSDTLRKIKTELDELNRKIESNEQLETKDKIKRQAAAYRLRKIKHNKRIHKRGRY